MAGRAFHFSFDKFSLKLRRPPAELGERKMKAREMETRGKGKKWEEREARKWNRGEGEQEKRRMWNGKIRREGNCLFPSSFDSFRAIQPRQHAKICWFRTTLMIQTVVEEGIRTMHVNYTTITNNASQLLAPCMWKATLINKQIICLPSAQQLWYVPFSDYKHLCTAKGSSQHSSRHSTVDIWDLQHLNWTTNSFSEIKI